MSFENLVADVNSIYKSRGLHVIKSKFVANGW